MIGLFAMMYPRSFALMALALICGLAAPARAQHENNLSLNTNNWILYQNGNQTLNSDGSGLWFDFPSVNKVNFDSETVNALWTNSSYSLAPLTGALYIEVDLQITTTGSPVFNYKFEKRNTCINPATARLWFARPNWKQNGEFYRWWSNPPAYALKNGRATLTVPIKPGSWSSVFGKFGSDNTDSLNGFTMALADLGQIGITFGGGCFLGHGVDVSGGAARFNLHRYSIGK